MATYAIGDIQGCFNALKKLLHKINFNPQTDQLWFTGDLVNRGPQSVEVLRYVKSLDHCAISVLGNHDFHCLATHYLDAVKPDPSLNALLSAPDVEELCDWLRQRPLLHTRNAFVLVHAGILPSWDLNLALSLAQEIETYLQSKNYIALLKSMYGNQPDHWDVNLSGFDRLRFIINVFTRMRFCKVDGSLDFSCKKGLSAQTETLIPWFSHPLCKIKQQKIIFGHWAALYNNWPLKVTNIYPLDSGCVWGNALTALRLEDEQYFSVTCN